MTLKHAVTLPHAAETLIPSSTLTRGDMIAFAELARARRMRVVNMFNGTRLKFGKSAMAQNAKDLYGEGKELADSTWPARRLTKAACRSTACSRTRAATS